MADLQRGQGSTMDFLMRMPDLATVDATVTVIGWLKEPGEQVKRGEPLLEVETDKAILPVESPVLGVLCEITALSGSEVEPGQVIARLTVDQHIGTSASLPAEAAKVATPATSPRQQVAAEKKSTLGTSSPRTSLFERNRRARADAQVEAATGATPSLSAYKSDFLTSLYERMVLIREFEDGVKFLFLEGAMPGTIHQCQGQEATAVGVCAALEASDFITSTFRGHGHALAKGLSPEELLFELFGAVTGCCRGKGGSMHVGNMSKGMVPGIAIVGGGVPLAAGMALALKMQKSRAIVACFFGDGAIAEGAFHEGVNLAAIWDLPVIFVCENNLYGASTRVDRVMRNERIADRAAAYGITGEGLTATTSWRFTRRPGRPPRTVARARAGVARALDLSPHRPLAARRLPLSTEAREGSVVRARSNRAPGSVAPGSRPGRSSGPRRSAETDAGSISCRGRRGT